MALFVLLLGVFSFNIAKKCDKYVVGTVWIHKGGSDDEGAANFEGCEKGCFFNGSYDDFGVRKCEKCTNIKDETICTDNGGTCRWKKGKCLSQSCPEMAKNLNAYGGDSPSAAVGRSRKYKECVYGTPKEQYFNEIYIHDYIDHVNSAQGVNATLTYNRNLCDDRQPQPNNVTNTTCRLLPGTARQRCEFNATQLWNNVNEINQRTPYEVCLNGPLKAGGGGQQLVYDNLPNPASDYKTITGYDSPQAYCQHQVDMNFTQCGRTYQNAVDVCYGDYGMPSSAQERDHVGTKAARAACHRIYHCMYSESNERCSVWAIWAVVFFIVVMVLVAAGVAVAGVAVFPQLFQKIRGYAKI